MYEMRSHRIRWAVLAELHDYDPNPDDPTELAPAHKASSGDHIWDVTAFTFGRPSADEPQQGGEAVCPSLIGDYYNQADSTPSFDYRLP